MNLCKTKLCNGNWPAGKACAKTGKDISLTCLQLVPVENYSG